MAINNSYIINVIINFVTSILALFLILTTRTFFYF